MLVLMNLIKKSNQKISKPFTTALIDIYMVV